MLFDCFIPLVLTLAPASCRICIGDGGGYLTERDQLCEAGAVAGDWDVRAIRSSLRLVTKSRTHSFARGSGRDADSKKIHDQSFEMGTC